VFAARTGNDLFVSLSVERGGDSDVRDPSAATSQLKVIPVLAPNRLNEEIFLADCCTECPSWLEVRATGIGAPGTRLNEK